MWHHGAFFGLVQDKEKRRQIRIFSAVKHDSFRGKRRIWKQLVSSANARGSGYCGDWRAKATSWPLLVPFWSSSSDLRTIEHRCWDTANTGVLGKCLPAWTVVENYAKSLIWESEANYVYKTYLLFLASLQYIFKYCAWPIKTIRNLVGKDFELAKNSNNPKDPEKKPIESENNRMKLDDTIWKYIVQKKNFRMTHHSANSMGVYSARR